jgi:hypothetical protein
MRVPAVLIRLSWHTGARAGSVQVNVSFAGGGSKERIYGLGATYSLTHMLIMITSSLSFFLVREILSCFALLSHHFTALHCAQYAQHILQEHRTGTVDQMPYSKQFYQSQMYPLSHGADVSIPWMASSLGYGNPQ